MLNKVNSEIIVVFAVAFVVLFALLTFLMFFIISYQKRRIYLEAFKKQLDNTYQEELLKAKLEVQETTQNNISLELHDNIGQTLTLVKMNLYVTASEMEINQKLEQSRALLTKAISDIRYISKTLNSDYIKNVGVVNAIKNEIENLRRLETFEVESRICSDTIHLPVSKELFLFRMFQEIVNNFLKHSNASKLFVEIRVEAEQLHLVVWDNGIGFDVESIMNSTTPESGLGVKSLYSRAKLLGGELNISSSSAGTITTFKINLDQK